MCIVESRSENCWNDATGTNITAIISGIVACIALLIMSFSLSDAYVMMNAPEYWVIKDIIGSIT